MRRTIAGVVLALAAPMSAAEGSAEPAGTPVSSAEATVIKALEDVDARLAVLRELDARHDAGERIPLDAIHGVAKSPLQSEERLDREKAAIHALRDEIRVAARSAPVRPRPEPAERPETGPEETGDATATETPVNETDPTPPATRPGPLRHRLADARYADGETVEALALYDAILKDGQDTWALLRRARCLERLGKTVEARTTYEALLRDHPEDRWAGAARFSLRMLDLAADERRSREGGRR
jgi:tetratricopeptide (TPR) repeat protein